MIYNHYNKKLRPYAVKHRNNSTKAEIRLWCELLRDKKMMGYPFLRQRPIDWYIADFFSKPLKLVIETDGITHIQKEVQEKDAKKTAHLESLGYSVLRFQDRDVMDNLDWVKKEIENWIRKNHPPAPFEGGQ